MTARHRWNNGDTCARCGLHREAAGEGHYGAVRYYHDQEARSYLKVTACISVVDALRATYAKENMP